VVRHVREHAGDVPEQRDESRLQVGGRDVEQQIAPPVDHLDHETRIGDLDHHLVLQLRDVRVLLRGARDRRLDLLRLALEALLLALALHDDDVLRHHLRLARLRLVHVAGDHRAAAQHARAPEVLRDLLAEPHVGLRQQPEHDEERHHRGHEVRVGDLPRAAVVRGVALLLPADDDARLRVLGGGHQPAAAFTARQAASVSSLDGRSSEKMALRANSTATMGAAPFSEAMTSSLMQRRYLPLHASSSSASSSTSSSSGEAVPFTICLRASRKNSTAWWRFRNEGYLLKIELFATSPTCSSSATAPFFRMNEKISYWSFRMSR